MSGDDGWGRVLSKRSTYILDGASSKLTSSPKPPFTMELLYLLLPIIGAFLLLFSVCCCGKTLKKMLHIPKEVVLGSYAAVQLHNQAGSSDSESSSSDDDDDEAQNPGQGRIQQGQGQGQENLGQSSQGQDHEQLNQSQDVCNPPPQSQGQNLLGQGHALQGQGHSAHQSEPQNSEEVAHRNNNDGTVRNQEGYETKTRKYSSIEETSDITLDIDSCHVESRNLESVNTDSDASYDQPVSIVVVPRYDINTERLDNRPCENNSCVDNRPCDNNSCVDINATKTDHHQESNQRKCMCQDKQANSYNQSHKTVPDHQSCQCTRIDLSNCTTPTHPSNNYANSRLLPLNVRMLEKNCYCKHVPTSQKLSRQCYNGDKAVSVHSSRSKRTGDINPRHICPHKSRSRASKGVSRDRKWASRDQNCKSRDHKLSRSSSLSCPLLTSDIQ